MQDEQRRAILGAVLKVVGVAVAVGLVIGLAAFVMVKALGFSDSTPAAHAATGGSASPSALPTVALSEPGSADPTVAASPTATPTKPKKKGIQLAASPGSVPPGGRINLTGRYDGQDSVSLQVQRKEAGTWTSFAGVQAQVRVGTFATYVLTSHQGENIFRVLDPTTGRSSNAVTVTVG